MDAPDGRRQRKARRQRVRAGKRAIAEQDRLVGAELERFAQSRIGLRRSHAEHGYAAPVTVLEAQGLFERKQVVGIDDRRHALAHDGIADRMNANLRAVWYLLDANDDVHDGSSSNSGRAARRQGATQAFETDVSAIGVLKYLEYLLARGRRAYEVLISAQQQRAIGLSLNRGVEMLGLRLAGFEILIEALEHVQARDVQHRGIVRQRKIVEKFLRRGQGTHLGQNVAHARLP